MSTICIPGRLTKDAEIRQGNGGVFVTFGVAETVFVQKEKQSQFFDCVFGGQRAEKVAQYLKKGTPVTVTGSFSKTERDGKTYLKVNVNDLALQGGAKNEPGGGGGGSTVAQSDPFGDIDAF